MALDSQTSGPELSDPQAIRVEMLNGFSVWDGDAVAALPASAARVVAYLALQQRPTARVSLAGLLWPETTEERAQASLRSAIWRARKALPGLISTGKQSVSLSEHVVVDVRALDRIASLVIAGEPPLEFRVIAEGRLGVELLPGWYDEWVLLERERIRLLTLRAVECASDWLRTEGDTAGAVQMALLAIDLEPMRESAHRSLVAAHLAHGNVWEAVRAYRDYARVLNSELGVSPSPEMTQLLTQSGVNAEGVAI